MPTMLVRQGLTNLIANYDKVRGLGWPLTAHDFQPQYNLIRKVIDEAETYMEEGQTDAAHAAIKVGNSAVETLLAMHEYETTEV